MVPLKTLPEHALVDALEAGHSGRANYLLAAASFINFNTTNVPGIL